MRHTLGMLAVGLAAALLPLDSHALGRNEKGCLVGGVAGGVGGKLLGDHPILGALAGCAVGNYVARDRALKDREAARREHRREEAARHRRRIARERHHTPAPNPPAS